MSSAHLLTPTQDPKTPELSGRETCLHCSLPLSSRQKHAEQSFCCPGCERVYALLHDAGLEKYYELRRGSGTPPLQTRSDDFPWLSDVLGSAGAAPGEPISLALDIQGIHCTGCVWVLESLFARHRAGVEIRVNSSTGRVDLIWDPDRGDLRDWLREAESFGYRFGAAHKPQAQESQGLLVRLGITVAAAVNVMIFSLCYYLGLAPEDGTLYELFGWLSAGLATVAFFAGGWVFIRSAVMGIRKRIVHLDLPIATGIVLAFGGSAVAHLRHGPEAAYFDTVTVFIALMLLGRWLQAHVLERNRRALLADSGVEELYTRRFRDGTLQSVLVSSVRSGEEIWVVPGDLVPVKGILVEHSAKLRLDWITGESALALAEPGETIPAGALNAGESTLRIAAQEDFEASRLNQLLGSSRGAGKAGSETWWRRVSLFYVTAVLSLAGAGFLAWIGHGIDRAIGVAVAILVVTCPCALGLAVPLAHELGHVFLRRRGIFIRESGFLERALSVRKILFDKTGTLTHGALQLDPDSLNLLSRLDPAQSEILLEMCSRSNHPVARSLHHALTESLATGAPPRVSREAEVNETHGQGLAHPRDGHLWRLGRRSFAMAKGQTDRMQPGWDELSEAVFSVDGREIAGFRFREHLKDDARTDLDRLEQEGYTLYLASGDVEARVRETASALGIPPNRARSGMSPEDKSAWIEELDSDDTLMVGDGLNDGPGFDRAYCTATPAVDHPSIPGRSDFYFLGSGIGAVGEALRTARSLQNVIRGNLVLAVLYNAIAVPLAFLGMVTPVVAAVLMPASSLLVVSLTAIRLSERRLRWRS